MQKEEYWTGSDWEGMEDVQQKGEPHPNHAEEQGLGESSEWMYIYILLIGGKVLSLSSMMECWSWLCHFLVDKMAQPI